MRTEALEGRGERLHPSSLVFELGKSFVSIVVMGIAVLVLAAGDRGQAFYMFVFVPVLVRALTRYISLRFWLTEDHLVVREGILFKKTRHVPYSRLQNIDTVQGPLHRMLDVVEVRLETASGTEPEAVLRVISTSNLAKVRDSVFPEPVGGEARAEESGAGEAANPAPVEPLPVFRMGVTDVALFGLFSQKGLAYASGSLYLIYELGLMERATSLLGGAYRWEELLDRRPWMAAVGVFGLFVILQLLTVVWAFVTLHGFRVVRRGNDLRAVCGLWTRQSATIARRRIQSLSLREGLFQRLFHRASVKVLTAGGDSTRENHISRKWIVPLTRRSKVQAVLDEVQPEARFEGLAWNHIHPRATGRMFRRWLFVLALPQGFAVYHLGPWALAALPVFVVQGYLLARWRAARLAWAVSDGAVFLRDGRLTWTRTCVRFSKIQSVSYLQSPFDRRAGMASIRIDTAGASSGDLELTVPYLHQETAQDLLRRLREAASAVSFRW